VAGRGLGAALASYAEKEHSDLDANRARSAAATLDRCQSAAAEAADELARGAGVGGVSSESAALAVAQARTAATTTR